MIVTVAGVFRELEVRRFNVFIGGTTKWRRCHIHCSNIPDKRPFTLIKEIDQSAFIEPQSVDGFYKTDARLIDVIMVVPVVTLNSCFQ